MESGVFKEQNHLELGCMKMELGHIHPMSKLILILIFGPHKQV